MAKLAVYSASLQLDLSDSARSLVLSKPPTYTAKSWLFAAYASEKGGAQAAQLGPSPQPGGRSFPLH